MTPTPPTASAEKAIREALPALDPAQIIPYSAIRYVNGYTEDYVKEYARTYAEAQLAELRAANERLREDERRREFTEKQCIDLFAAALYISARDDESSVLSEENAERISAFLCDLAGVDLDAALGEEKAP